MLRSLYSYLHQTPIAYTSFFRPLPAVRSDALADLLAFRGCMDRHFDIVFSLRRQQEFKINRRDHQSHSGVNPGCRSPGGYPLPFLS